MRVDMWTDGGCKPNPGVGAWACILKAEGMLDKELSGKILDADGAVCQTTSNRAELIAFHNALKALKNTPHAVVLHTDSRYVKLAIRGMKKPTENHDLLAETKRLVATLTRGVTIEPVKGHSGQADNERCHQLVQNQLRIIHE